MAVDPAKLSLQEIRDRYLRDGAPVSRQILSRLKRDKRRGVRQLCATLEKRLDRQRQERMRRDAMLNFERVLWRTGLTRIAGVDEVGIGPLAGPVVAAAVVFPPDTFIDGVDDSKRLTVARREELDAAIRQVASGVGIGVTPVEEVDRINVYQAGLLAMKRAVEALPEPPQHVLTDARTIPDLAVPQNRFDRGDGLDFSIAAASIVAKVYRDRLMTEYASTFPQYGFDRHKGYGTADHQNAIRRYGPCPIHRRSFSVLHELQGEYADAFYDLRHTLGAASVLEHITAWERSLEQKRSLLSEAEVRKLRILANRRWRLLQG